MMRKTIAAAVPVVAVLLCAPANAYVKKSGPATLTAASIVFNTKDDDKDRDSTENITVTCGEHAVGELSNAGAGTVWRDQTSTPALSLVNVDQNIEPADCGTIKVGVSHSTNGNDNWKFSFSVTLRFSDGSSYVYDYPATIELTKNNGQGQWELQRRR
jgi:hypothetical protein